MGKKEQAQELLKLRIEETKEKYTLHRSIAILYFALGEIDKGFEWLNSAFDRREPGLRHLKIDQNFDSVRSDPRFIALLKKINLE